MHNCMSYGVNRDQLTTKSASNQAANTYTVQAASADLKPFITFAYVTHGGTGGAGVQLKIGTRIVFDTAAEGTLKFCQGGPFVGKINEAITVVVATGGGGGWAITYAMIPDLTQGAASA